MLVYEFLINPLKEFNYDSEKKEAVKKFIKEDKKLKHWGLKIEDLIDLEGAKTNLDAFAEILKTYRNKHNQEAHSIVFKATRLIDIYAGLSDEITSKYNIKFISLIRDGRAVYASQKRTVDPYTNGKMSNNPLITAEQWNNLINRSNKYKDNPDFIIIKYEALIKNLREEMSHLLGRLNTSSDLSFLSDKGDLVVRIPRDQISLHPNILKSADIQKINAWRRELSANEIYLFEKYAGDSLSMMGYKILLPKISSAKFLFYELSKKLRFLYFKLKH